MAEKGGEIYPTCHIAVEAGSSQSYIIIPESGYYIEDLLIDGVSCGATDSYDFENIKNHHTINALFKLSPSGYEEINNNVKVRVYPNPGEKYNHFLYVEILGSNTSVINMAVYDILGRNVFFKKYCSEINRLVELPFESEKGIYILVVNTTKGKIVKKVVRK